MILCGCGMCNFSPFLYMALFHYTLEYIPLYSAPGRLCPKKALLRYTLLYLQELYFAPIRRLLFSHYASKLLQVVELLVLYKLSPLVLSA